MATPARPTTLTSAEARVVRAWQTGQACSGYLGTVVLTSGAVLLASGSDHRWTFRIGTVLTVGGLALQVITGPRYRTLIDRERDARVRAGARSMSLQRILNAGLRTLMEDLDVDFGRARISLYRFKDDHSIRLARVSDTMDLESEGRDRYPKAEGVLVEAVACLDEQDVDGFRVAQPS